MDLPAGRISSVDVDYQKMGFLCIDYSESNQTGNQWLRQTISDDGNE